MIIGGRVSLHGFVWFRLDRKTGRGMLSVGAKYFFTGIDVYIMVLVAGV